MNYSKRFSITVITIFMILLIAPGITWCAVKLIYHNQPEAMAKIDFDLGENRSKAPFPDEVRIKTFGTELEEYMNDRVPYRSALITVNRKIDSLWEKLEPVNEGENFPLRISNGATIMGREGWLFFASEQNINNYHGGNKMSTVEMEADMALMEKLQAICKEQDKKLLIAVFPDKEEVYPEYMPTVEVADEYKRVERFRDYIKDNSDVNFIYPVEDLIAQKDKWQLYYKRDTHWNAAGAFLGVQAVYKALEMPTMDINELTLEEYMPGACDLVHLGNLNEADYQEDTDYKVWYEVWLEPQKEENYYDNENLSKYTSESENNEKLVIIGDSYRIGMAPFIAKDFKETISAHRDVISEERVIQGLKDADVILIEAVERNEGCIIQDVGNIINILIN